jgi:hypothetical protein
MLKYNTANQRRILVRERLSIQTPLGDEATLSQYSCLGDLAF